MIYFIALIFALLPSIAWLLFYLRKDTHPESNWQVMKIFFYGMLAALPAIFLELGIFELLASIKAPAFLTSLLLILVGVALVEELLKYLVVKGKVLRNAEFDEPTDAVLYMIIAALGFAASENILIFFGPDWPYKFVDAFFVSGFRFIGATFLHALCSGIIGFFIALSLFKTTKRKKLIITGLFIAIALHGLYDFSIIEIDGLAGFIVPIIILIGLAVWLSFAIQKLKRLKSICLPDKKY
ncbi:MAG: PrsW family intramembrane metalloprotease [Patescibacteria group bacterium]|nr:PrsW family intramembrane metalloprotease [Patescibacteria group bacterium]